LDEACVARMQMVLGSVPYVVFGDAL
jgi:hypothetical protein